MIEKEFVNYINSLNYYHDYDFKSKIQKINLLY